MSSSPTSAPDPRLDRAIGKVMRRTVPLFFVMLVCNQLDRTNISFASHHLKTDVGVGAAAYGLGAGLFFISYAIFELPSNLLLERFGAKIWLTRIMVSWGVVSAAMMLVNGPTSFYVLRFLLGATEAGFFPAVIFYFARWLPDSHRGRATALFVAGSSIAAAIGGPISGPLLSIHAAGLHGWQWMFGIEGVLSVVVGVIAFFLLDSSIEKAAWLTLEERAALAARIAVEDATRTADGRGGPAVSRWKLLGSPQVLLFCGIYFAIQLSIYANTFWLPTIIKRIPGTTDTTVGLLSALPWVSAVIAMYLTGRAADRSGRSKPLLVASLVVAGVATWIAAMASPVAALVMLCVAAMGFKSASPLFWSIPQAVLRPAVLAPAIAVINALGNLGGFVAPYGFGLVKQRTGQLTYGLYALALACLLGAALVLLVRKDRHEPALGGEPA